MSRAPKSPIIYQEKLKLSKEIIRFATPKEPALYRAQRLKCNTIAEIGAGIGGQTLAFAKTCKKVIAVEINPEDAKILKQNLFKLDIKNVEVIVGDALSQKIIDKIKSKKPEIIFCDTARKPEGERKIKDIEPNIKKLLEEYFPITKKIAIEIPPFTSDTETLKENFEKEFISLNHQLNRLTLYFNELKNFETSVIALPSKEKLNSSNEKIKIPELKKIKEGDYLFEIDQPIILAKLENELSEKFGLEKTKIADKDFFISEKEKNSSFLNQYKIISISENKFEKIIEELKKIKAGKVILKYKIEPEKYWQERKNYEDKLSGTEEAYLFLDKKQAIICKR